MKISTEFWDFIEKYLPGYHQRDDVLRQGQLKQYIDGQESSLANEMSVDEAEDEYHHILYNLYFEVIHAYTQSLGAECDECRNNNQSAFCPVCGKKLN